MVPNFLRFGRFGTVTLVLLAFGLLAAPALAQDVPVTDDDVNAVAKDLFCPVCESTPLDVCPTQACADWRDLIRQQLSEGYTPQEVEEYFARQYGDGVLANPPKRGFSLVLWLLPVVAVAVGGLVFGRYMTALRASASGVRAEMAEDEFVTAVSTPATQPRSQDDYKARLEDELHSR